MTSARKLRLAGYVLDLGAARLRDAQGRTVPLRPQAWAVLLHLASNAGRVVSKEELIDAIWPHVVVTEDSLTQAVSDVRAGLGEAGRRVIKTVPKRGFLLLTDALEPVADAGTSRPAPRTNLPAELNRLIGREADIAALTAGLAEHRLVTVLGAGGIGKTRLAQAVAREELPAHDDGVWWIDLAALSAAEQVAPAIAMAANLQLDEGDAATSLARALAQRETLLVLDNCERLVDAVAAIAQAVLTGAPSTRVLATSQETLRVAGEHVYRLDTLSVPPPQAALAAARRFSAMQLLEQRAQEADPPFELCTETVGAASGLCRQLDGIPLAIEMAAARLPTLGVDAVCHLVAQQLLRNPLRGAPPRQQTLRATLESSHALLDEREQRVLRRLSVFAGSLELEVAQRVVAVDGLSEADAFEAIAALVDKSLLKVQRLEPPRYRLLETMRLFASEQLDASGETEAALLRHVLAMTVRAEAIERDYWVSTDAVWLARYRADFDDLQAACDRAVARRDAYAVGVLVFVLRRFEYLFGIRSTIARRVEAVNAVMPGASGRGRALLLCLVSWGGYSGPTRLVAEREALALCRELGDMPLLYQELSVHAVTCAGVHDQSSAEDALREASELERPEWPPRLRLFGAASAAVVSGLCGQVETYRGRCLAALALAQSAGFARYALSMRLELANASMMAGDLGGAVEVARAIVEDTSASGHSAGLCEALTTLCAALSRNGELHAAASAARRALPIALRDGRIGPLFDHVALLSALSGHAEVAARLLGCSDAWNAGIRRTRRPSEARSAELAAERAEPVLGAAEFERLRADGAKLSAGDGGALAEAFLDQATRGAGAG